LVNAVRHPGANTIQLVSLLRTNADRTKGEFAISFWDDGKAIAQTLQSVAQRGLHIGPATAIGLKAKYNLTTERAFAKNQVQKFITSEQMPSSAGGEEEFLLAATYPGTTSDALGHNEDFKHFGDDRNALLAQPGMGLYLLANTAVSVYGGSVLLRSGHWSLTLKPDVQADSYLARMRHYDRWPRFHGNMITVRLPLRSERS
jgi:hypothetical protein